MTDLTGIPWISATVFLPLVGALILMMVPAEHDRVHRTISMSFLVATFFLALALFVGFDGASGGFQRVENKEWIATLGANWHVAIDGISLWLILTTTFLAPFIVLAAARSITTRVKEFHLAVLVLVTSVLGVLVARDMLLFYVFWELMLIPIYLLLGIWGGRGRIRAAQKLFTYTMAGSLLMLVGILYVYTKGGGTSFAIDHLISTGQTLSSVEQGWLFAAFGAAFFIKFPVVPLHTWMADFHEETPAGGAVDVAALLVKLGPFAFIRLAMPMFPDAFVGAAPYLAFLGVFGIIYGALIAWVQTDLKRVLVFSSISHVGFILLGLSSLKGEGMTGAMFQMVAHSLMASGLFLSVGMLQERRGGSRSTADYGGLATPMPKFAFLLVVLAMGAIGVPGLAGFVGEFLILLGSSQSTIFNVFGLNAIGETGFGPDIVATLLVVFAATGVIFGAFYLLKLVKAILFGPTSSTNATLPDLSWREVSILAPLALVTVLLGVRPMPVLQTIEPAVESARMNVASNLTERAHGERMEAADLQRQERLRFFVRLADEPWSIQRQMGAEAGESAH